MSVRNCIIVREKGRAALNESRVGKEREGEGEEKKKGIWWLFVCAPSGLYAWRHDGLIDPPQCLSWAVRIGIGIVFG